MKSNFRAWLLAQGYQPSTAAATCLALRRLSRPYGLTGQKTDKPHLQRYLSFVRATRDNPLGQRFLRDVKALGVMPVTKGWVKAGRRRKPLLTAEQFAQFRAQLRKEAGVGMLTALYTQSGLRVGMFLLLRMPEAIEAYPLYAKWLQDFDTVKIRWVYQIVADTQRGAYLQMRAVAQGVAKTLGVEADLDSLYKSRLQLAG